MVDWILILFRWLIAMPDRAVRVLETGWTVVAGTVVAEMGCRATGLATI